jgi:hypothetical protein
MGGERVGGKKSGRERWQRKELAGAAYLEEQTNNRCWVKRKEE